MKLPVLSINFIKFCLPVFVAVLIFSHLVMNSDALAEPKSGNGVRGKRIVVLDAGHGGHDTGASTSEGILEKTVNMTFVKILAEKLRSSHRVHLTRTDDYRVDLVDRPALANYLEADLFLSIHTGASMLKTPNGVIFSYFDNSTALQLSSRTSETGLPAWETSAPRHTQKSRYLAGLLKDGFKAFDANLYVDIRGMPLFVLEGADQPSLMIEIGYLTNPSDLKVLRDDEKLRQYADVVNDAVDTFFRKISAGTD